MRLDEVLPRCIQEVERTKESLQAANTVYPSAAQIPDLHLCCASSIHTALLFSCAAPSTPTAPPSPVDTDTHRTHPPVCKVPPQVDGGGQVMEGAGGLPRGEVGQAQVVSHQPLKGPQVQRLLQAGDGRNVFLQAAGQKKQGR